MMNSLHPIPLLQLQLATLQYICMQIMAVAHYMQALGMLFWHKHSFEKALADLPNFTPFPDEWTVEDRVLFEQAFNFHGKSFQRIRQMVCLPLWTAFVKRISVCV